MEISKGWRAIAPEGHPEAGKVREFRGKRDGMMAAFARAIAWMKGPSPPIAGNDVSEIELDGRKLSVPSGVQRIPDGWRSKRHETEEEPASTRTFYDASHRGDPKRSLKRAVEWMQRQWEPAVDEPRAPAPICAQRRLTLIRRVLKGKQVPRLELMVLPRKSSEARRWMRIYLGTQQSVTQGRIDEAVHILETRNGRFRELCADHGREFALSKAGTEHLIGTPVAYPVPTQTRLLAENAIAFNGVGENIGFSPRRDVSKDHAVPPPAALEVTPSKPKRKKKPWTEAEDGRLARYCKTMSINDLMAQHFPKRSYHSIAQRISHIKLSSNRKEAAQKGRTQKVGEEGSKATL